MTPRLASAFLFLSVLIGAVAAHAAWNTTGTPICAAAGFQSSQSMCSDGAAGAIVTWMDPRDGNSDIYIQRINAAGAVLWAVNGAAICTNDQLQRSPRVTSDGAGGAFVVWEDARNTPNVQYPSFDLYAQRVNAAGVPQWTPDGIVVTTASENDGTAVLTTDGASGIVVGWTHGDGNGPTARDIWAQRINTAGVAQWTANGLSICGTVGNQESGRVVADNSGGVFVAWQDSRNGSSHLYAQHVD